MSKIRGKKRSEMYKSLPEIERLNKDAMHKFLEIVDDWIDRDECPNILDVEEYVGAKLTTLRKYARMNGYHIHMDGNWMDIHRDEPDTYHSILFIQDCPECGKKLEYKKITNSDDNVDVYNVYCMNNIHGFRIRRDRRINRIFEIASLRY